MRFATFSERKSTVISGWTSLQISIAKPQRKFTAYSNAKGHEIEAAIDAETASE